MTEIMKSLSHSVASIAMIMLLISGAGSLKQVLVDGGVSDYIGGLLSQSSLSPLFLGWLIAAVLRICIGSATVSGLTAAGIVLPLVTGTRCKSGADGSCSWLRKPYLQPCKRYRLLAV